MTGQFHRTVTSELDRQDEFDASRDVALYRYGSQSSVHGIDVRAAVSSQNLIKTDRDVINVPC